MKYFVTGANGFLGKNVCAQLERSNHEVIRYDRSRPAVIPTGTEHVIHLAAEIYNEAVMFDVNVQLTRELLESASNADLQSFIYVGSSSEYGRKVLPMCEADMLEPRTMYEATKACGTMLVYAYSSKYRIPSAVVRPFSVFGPGEPPHRFIPTLLRASITGEPVNVSPGTHDFIYIDDFVNQVLAVQDIVSTHPYGICDIVNAGTGVETTNIEVVRLVEQITGQQINYTLIPNKLRTFDSDHWSAVIKKISNWYFAAPRYTLETGLRTWISSRNGVPV